MKIKFENHWRHEHIMFIAVQWGDYFGEYFEITILNFGVKFYKDYFGIEGNEKN